MNFTLKNIKIVFALVLAITFYVSDSFATGQISDTFIFKGNVYSLIGKTDGDIAHPKQFGMNPVMIHTACYRGFYASYELTDEAIILKELTLREKETNYLPITGVKPDIDTEKNRATYKGLNIKVNFTGKIRLAKDFIKQFYIHMGFQKPTAFKTVFDITVKEGSIVEIKDRSKEMEKKRGEFKQRFESGELRQSIEESFSLDMKLE